MSLTRRDMIAWFLVLASALCWTVGYRMISGSNSSNADETTYRETWNTTISSAAVASGPTIHPTTIPYPAETNAASMTTGLSPTYNNDAPSAGEVNSISRGQKFLGYVLCIAALAAAVCSVFLLWQKSPLIGPDMILLLLGFENYYLYIVRQLLTAESAPVLGSIIAAVCILAFIREIYGWLRSRASLKWCTLQCLAERCLIPQLKMLIYVVWISLAVAAVFILNRGFPSLQLPIGILAFAFLGLCCIWKYGMDLHHFQKQLANFRSGDPVDVGSGSFSADEQQLLQIRTEHEEAVKTAVTSERFKVELVSNVSHDLRTPLTSILGYGELLQKEDLSDIGREQLSRLNQKAGYMRDLVDSLFELTKVSSGVIESKREQIDLIRLLEQTVGLFDDQLTAAGLEVRRHYESNTVPVITDGARMHQVFANLLGNAIKYALSGTRIHLEVKEKEDAWQIRMVNTASYEMDFAPEEIMQRFARGDKARSTRGSGLGLAIAQTYTQSVGGSFTVAVDGDQFSAIVRLPKN